MTKPTPRSPAINPATVPEQLGSGYPSPFRERCAARSKRKLGDATGLTQFGVNLVTLPPGVESSMRHWHTREDEFVYVLEGELTLVTDAGEQVLGPGACAGFPVGKKDGHHFVNRSNRPARYLEIGTRDPMDECDYPDIDLLIRIVGGKQKLVHKDGAPY
jgi:uncharacterized cupin superfamily protein